MKTNRESLITFYHFWFHLFANSNQLVTTESLDYEEYESYALLVVVSDGMFSDSLVVAVEVLDSNDNSPKFNTTVYNFELDENLQNDVVEVGYYYCYNFT